MNSQHTQHPRAAKLPGIVAKRFQSLPMHRMSTIQLCPMSFRRKMAPDPAIHPLPWLWSRCRRANCTFRLAPECAAWQSISWPPSPRNCAPPSNSMPSISIANDLPRRTGAAVLDVLSLAHVPPALSPKHIPMQTSISGLNSILFQRKWRQSRETKRKLLGSHRRPCCLSSGQETRRANRSLYLNERKLIFCVEINAIQDTVLFIYPANRVQSFQVPYKPGWPPVKLRNQSF